MLNTIAKFLSLTALISVVSFNAFGECRLDSVRIDTFRDTEKAYIVGFSNFEDKAGIYFDKADMDETKQELLAFFKEAATSKRNFFDIQLKNHICDYMDELPENSRSYFQPHNVLKYAESQPELGCLCDITNSSTPTMFMLPTMNEVEKILKNSIGLPSKKIKEFQESMIKMFMDMNPQRPEANSLALPLILLEKLKLLGVKKIDNAQLSYLIGMFDDKLKPEELKLMENIIDQVEELEFSNDKKGRTVIELHTYQNDINIEAADIPTENDEQKKLLEETLHYAKVENGARLVYLDTDEDKGLEKEVRIDGLEIFGTFPVVGKLKISPRKATIDLNNNNVPAKIKVKIKKGISINWTFDIKS